MNKEGLLSDRRKELIRPEVFEPEDFWNHEARRLVSTFREALVKGQKEELEFSVPLFKKPYFAYQSEWFSSINLDIRYLNRKDDRIVLHKDRVIIHYDVLEVDRFHEFVKAVENGTVYKIYCRLEADHKTGRLPIFIDPRGNISLSGVKIPAWESFLT